MLSIKKSIVMFVILIVDYAVSLILIVTHKLFMASVIMLNVVMLIVVILNVVAPFLLQSIDLDLFGRVRTLQFYLLSMLDSRITV
jgi:hypothetical protein